MIVIMIINRKPFFDWVVILNKLQKKQFEWGVDSGIND